MLYDLPQKRCVGEKTTLILRTHTQTVSMCNAQVVFLESDASEI